MSWAVHYVPPREINYVWPICGPQIARAFKYGRWEQMSIEDVRNQLREGRGMLWVAVDSALAVRASMLFWTIGPRIEVAAMGGSGLRGWHGIARRMALRYSREQGKPVEMETRPRFARILCRMGWRDIGAAGTNVRMRLEDVPD